MPKKSEPSSYRSREHTPWLIEGTADRLKELWHLQPRPRYSDMAVTLTKEFCKGSNAGKKFTASMIGSKLKQMPWFVKGENPIMITRRRMAERMAEIEAAAQQGSEPPKRPGRAYPDYMPPSRPALRIARDFEGKLPYGCPTLPQLPSLEGEDYDPLKAARRMTSLGRAAVKDRD